MSVIAKLEALPTSDLTVTALTTLDKVIPGEWENITRFDAIAAELSGQNHPAVLAAIRERAVRIEQADPNIGRALQVFTMVDTVDQAAAGAAIGSKALDLASSMFSSLGALKQFAPKPDTTQAVDAGVKLVAEVVAFGLLHGVPTTEPGSLKRFAGALEDYGRYDLMRIAAWVVFDGMLPLGPNFLQTITTTVRGAASSSLTNNPIFDQLAGRLPGNTADDKRGFILETVDQTSAWVSRFITEKQITQQGQLAQLQGVLGVADGGLDYVAAALDASTAYTTHTGTQTVARALARRAIDGLRDEAWQEWVAARSR